MLDREMLYNLIYALAARDGREAKLFGTCAPLAREAFRRSLAGDYFPELWFELPLAGDPWFDLHALVSRGSLDPNATFPPETCGNNPGAFAWFAAQKANVRQLALSWDVSAGDLENPAVQLLLSDPDKQTTCDFLTAAGRSDAVPSYCAFIKRLSKDWFACYSGVFPRREEPHLRVECIPDTAVQRAYAKDASLLEADLRQAGLTDLGDTIIPRCQELAATPFRLEFQFDLDENGCAGPTFSASTYFPSPSLEETREPFEPDGAGGKLMELTESWGLADDRWRLLADTRFSQRVSFEGNSNLIYCFVAFLKLRWRNGIPIDAKTYLVADVEQED